ncbi:hypothetical protein ET475_05230 [Microbacterium protaetiae]|uniref:Helix-turn-helix domain-containing protein n=1 Tax=Microbacterium protaetiae TaxID=2509458 RepID=A0A4P6EBU2_9MICO|nr:hypothetical protein [Microbacterium protaetiae]QAY59454.1 hypothetical protein ET475_05230 [Microbacterium protaetiae]
MSAYAVAARAGLDHAPTLVFVYMAAIALDTDRRPVFYGGRDALAGALRAPLNSNGYRSVERAVQTLTSKRVLEVAATDAPGRNTRYWLCDGAGLPLSADTRRSVVETPDAQRRPEE